MKRRWGAGLRGYSGRLMVVDSSELQRELAALRTLQDVLSWGFSRSPAWEIVEVVVQDEYCHDVVIRGPLRGEVQLYLCFDTT